LPGTVSPKILSFSNVDKFFSGIRVFKLAMGLHPECLLRHAQSITATQQKENAHSYASQAILKVMRILPADCTVLTTFQPVILDMPLEEYHLGGQEQALKHSSIHT
jgi:hypothetical protein